MKIVGLIAEYNPFHNGHLYHVQAALKATGADAAVVVASGDYVQRGIPAIMPKHLRAEMALRGGVAAVFELPVCYATGSAELFAFGAVSLLDALGVDSICFGSECGDLQALQRLADILCKEPEEYRRFLKMYVKEGISFPAARERAVSEYLTVMDDFRQDASHPAIANQHGHTDTRQDSTKQTDCAALLGEPNNILGIEYLKALQKLNSRITPCTVRRVSSTYHDDTLRSEHSSASAIRKELEQGEASAIREELGQGEVPALARLENQVPPSCMDILKEFYHRSYPITVDDFSLLLKYKLLTTSDEDLPLYQDVSQELANRIQKMQDDFHTYTQFGELLMTRQLTRTRVNRALLHILLDIKKADVEHHLANGIHYYARLLGFREDCGNVVSEIARRTRLPLLTSPGKFGLSQFDERTQKNARQMLKTDIFASNLYNSVVTDKYGTPCSNELSHKMLKV